MSFQINLLTKHHCCGSAFRSYATLSFIVKLAGGFRLDRWLKPKKFIVFRAPLLGLAF